MSRRSFVTLLDALALGVGLLWLAIAAADGFILRLGDIRLSLRSPGRALFWLAFLVAVRIVLDRHRLPFGLKREGFWRSGADLFQVQVAPGVWRRAALASFGIAAALALLLHQQLAQMYAVPDLGDPLFSMWRVSWVLHQLARDPANLFNANIFHPEPLTLTFSDPMLLTAVLAAPLVWLGVHPVITYQVLLLFAFWASGVAVYLLAERLTGSPRAAFVAGLIYACYSFRFDHYSHLELQMTQWMPLGLLALHLFVATGRWPYALALALAGVAQLYSAMYFAVFFLIYVAVVGVGLLLAHRPPLRALAVPAIAAAVLAGVLAVPLVRVFVAAQPAKGERPVFEITTYSATLFDYVRAHRYSVLWSGRLPPPEPERGLFPGAAPAMLGAIGLAPPLTAVRAIYAAALYVSVDASLGFNGVWYPYLHRWLLPIRGLRAPARFGALVGLTLAIFSGFGAWRVLRRARSRIAATTLFMALVAGVMLDAWPSLTLTPLWKGPPAIYDAIKGRPGVVLAEFPVTTSEPLNLPYMYFSIWHWTPMVNGYSGFIPRSYAASAPDLLDFPRGNTAAQLRRRGVTHATLNCGMGYAGCAETARLMSESPELRLVLETVWEGERVRLYELRPATPGSATLE